MTFALFPRWDRCKVCRHATGGWTALCLACMSDAEADHAERSNPTVAPAKNGRETSR